MNREKELKYLLDNINFNTISNILREAGMTPTLTSLENQTNTYFDTPDMKLYFSKCTMRIRHSFNDIDNKGHYEFTYKGENKNTDPNSFMDRLEPSISFDSMPSFDKALKLFKEQYPEIDLPEGLRKIVTLKNHRQIYDISSNKASVEMCFDTPSAIIPKTAEEISIPIEVEFESKDGQTILLKKIEEAIKAFDPSLKPSTSSKYERLINLVLARAKEDTREDMYH